MGSDAEKLGQLCRIKQGRYLAPSDMKDSPEFGWTIPVIGGNGILGYTSRPSHTIDVPLVTCRGSKCGLLQWGKAPLWVSNNAMACDTGNLSGNRFLRYLLASIDFDSVITGSAQPQITIGHLSEKPVQVPSKDSWQGISEMLGLLDDKITLLKETNATLEAIAHAIFKSWFVDFDPVRAKAEGRDPEGVPSEVADLFPSEFEDSELGAIPKGWRAGTLADLADLNPESWTNKVHPNTLLYVDLANTKDNRIEAVTEYQFEDAPSRARRVLRSGDTIVGTVRPGNRSFAFVVNPPPTLTGSTGFAVLRPLNPSGAEFVFIAATRTESIDRLAHLADGGAYPAVRPEVVQSLTVAIPTPLILEAFHQIAASLFDRVSANELEAKSLADLRDILLPRLMSGELRMEGATQGAEVAS